MAKLYCLMCTCHFFLHFFLLSPHFHQHYLIIFLALLMPLMSGFSPHGVFAQRSLPDTIALRRVRSVSWATAPRDEGDALWVGHHPLRGYSSPLTNAPESRQWRQRASSCRASYEGRYAAHHEHVQVCTFCIRAVQSCLRVGVSDQTVDGTCLLMCT